MNSHSLKTDKYKLCYRKCANVQDVLSMYLETKMCFGPLERLCAVRGDRGEKKQKPRRRTSKTHHSV